MNVTFSPEDLRPVVLAVVEQVLTSKATTDATLGYRLAFPESEAAALLGVPRHVLRDARLRGEIHGKLIGKKIVYSREALEKFLKK